MEKTGLKYGLLTAAALIAYFMLMRVFGLADVIELRFLNGVIMAFGVVLAIKGYKERMHGKIGYFKGLATGIITAVVGTTLFAAFMVVYVKLGGEALIETLSAERYFGERVVATPGVVIFSVLMLEGVISGFMIAFIAMQYFKQREHKVPGGPS
ncbi:DUF4199 domain-containing protein [Pontibacter actiniarum]|uniref:DUF4199 domain-containing protein n=1 Tax=Pontibacter actiniarum TaxID=323450 RepID=A0A1X9YQI7_9BACT|nr:DUF4199 domain-containing protein [Pontibacter actiniarum]ARS35133.1 DUF4199 domain-containing protein [Pontibacter actiniarum]